MSLIIRIRIEISNGKILERFRIWKLTHVQIIFIIYIKELMW